MFARPEVATLEATPQLARLDADDRIVLRVEVRVATEHPDGDGVGLQLARATGKRLLDHEAQEAPEPFRRDEPVAGEDALERTPHRDRRRLSGGMIRIVSPGRQATSRIHTLICACLGTDRHAPRG